MFVCFNTEADMSEVIIKFVHKLTCENRSRATRRCANGYVVPDFTFKCPVWLLGPRDAASSPVVLGHSAAALGPRKTDS